MENIRAHVFVSGRVQGVFFRSYTQDKAKELNLKGWVRNTRDRKVEALFEGEKESVEAMIKWCYEGPPYAKVTNVEVKWEQLTGEFSTFGVRY